MQLLPGDGVLDLTKTMYPMRLSAFATSRRFANETATFYGYVVGGRASLRANALVAELPVGHWFCVPGAVELELTQGRVVLIERFGFRGMLTLGSIESVGRLSYIDGCSDSILCCPPRLGDPVLNHLHFPAQTKQTLHRHPSVRLGVVARGSGCAVGGERDAWEQPLEEGIAFSIDAHELHAFRTSSVAMDVIAFHPDSDWGPTDATHPMLNRTYRI